MGLNPLGDGKCSRPRFYPVDAVRRPCDHNTLIPRAQDECGPGTLKEVLMKRHACLVVALFAGASVVRAESPGDLVRIDSGVSGHIHPALCVTPKGTLIATYCHAEY